VSCNRDRFHSVVLSVKLGRRRGIGACVVTLALLLVAGCSGGSTADVANRGPCPKTYPALSRRFSLKAVNEGIDGLEAKLVPISVPQVRVCRYDSRGGALSGTAVLKQAAAARFEASTNRLETRTSPPTARLTCPEFDTFLLAFTTATEGVAVAVAGCGSGIASNGTLTVVSTRTWLNELTAITKG
jgi:hypothetical protein